MLRYWQIVAKRTDVRSNRDETPQIIKLNCFITFFVLELLRLNEHVRLRDAIIAILYSINILHQNRLESV